MVPPCASPTDTTVADAAGTGDAPPKNVAVAPAPMHLVPFQSAVAYSRMVAKAPARTRTFTAPLDKMAVAPAPTSAVAPALAVMVLLAPCMVTYPEAPTNILAIDPEGNVAEPSRPPIIGRCPLRSSRLLFVFQLGLCQHSKCIFATRLTLVPRMTFVALSSGRWLPD